MLNKYVPKTQNQEKYIRSIIENQVVIATGPSGTGKTALAICLACEHLVNDKIEQIILTKPFIGTGPTIGFLPGNAVEKTLPYLTPFNEYLDYFLGIEQHKKFVTEGKIKVQPMEYMRGVTFSNSSIVILDEAQNCTSEQIIMVLTRLSNYSKLIINGDIKQTDLNGRYKSGLDYVVNKIKDVEGVDWIQLDRSDILRSGIIRKILERLEND